MDRANQAFAKILFSDDNLNSDMEVGFKGNPNIGSVVLNRFTQSVQFLDFASDFQGGDKIFIISSIFGGTGASGFPVLLKNLRTLLQKDSQFPNGKEIQDCVIGAISVLRLRLFLYFYPVDNKVGRKPSGYLVPFLPLHPLYK